MTRPISRWRRSRAPLDPNTPNVTIRTLRQFAAARFLSVSTVRRRLALGRYRGKKFGGEWYVFDERFRI